MINERKASSRIRCGFKNMNLNRISDLVFSEPFMYNYFQNEGLAADYKIEGTQKGE